MAEGPARLWMLPRDRQPGLAPGRALASQSAGLRAWSANRIKSPAVTQSMISEQQPDFRFPDSQTSTSSASATVVSCCFLRCGRCKSFLLSAFFFLALSEKLRLFFLSLALEQVATSAIRSTKTILAASLSKKLPIEHRPSRYNGAGMVTHNTRGISSLIKHVEIRGFLVHYFPPDLHCPRRFTYQGSGFGFHQQQEWQPIPDHWHGVCALGSKHE